MVGTVDYIVVGAGPAGCAVASRLARAPGSGSVALFETGPRQAPHLSNIPLGLAALVPLKSRFNYGYQTTPQAALNGRRGYQPRGRGVGGSSLINAMIYIRGQPEDYDGWAELGCKGWSWQDVLPYFKRSEDNVRGKDAWHGAGGPLRVSELSNDSPATAAFVEAAVQAGYPYNADFNGESQEGVGPYQVFQKDGARYNAGRAYLDARPAMTNLQVLAGQQVRRIVFDGRRAIGVAFGPPNREEMMYAKREIIISGGAFGSPQLLMVSGIGPEDQLRQHGINVISHAPDVGANLQDHLDYIHNMWSKAPGLFGMTLPVLLRGASSFPAYLSRGKGMLTTNAAEAGGFIRSSPEIERPDLQLHFCIGFVDDHNRKLHLGTGMALHVCILRPKSRGSVRLASRDIADAPLIDPNFLSHPDDLRTLVRGAQLTQKILAAPALAAMNGRALYGTGDEDEEGLVALIRQHSDTIYHPVGTCRMGADSRSVVDPELRVRGVEGLRVADASIMPNLISGNTQAPSAMIGEKAADLILAKGLG
ncbi:GMC family oxidoreductase [Phyllobacterium myrsinacearum]|uniref:Choline dehydrogenase-like flavoprotein n=1 Tax=Phyllobacterium myrsinacearum TaxID=28101 RepID=A0A839EP89_9HYPH|nr:GMC family oxidoreductase N-terminal domain-containing protein [Phyllobacterium myrsinacearum]MBA8880652.1 choline dehydrogenase-like flavoprotein [Phyllobacterium myrsinacearum]